MSYKSKNWLTKTQNKLITMIVCRKYINWQNSKIPKNLNGGLGVKPPGKRGYGGGAPIRFIWVYTLNQQSFGLQFSIKSKSYKK